ncbi:MAG: SDR family oxidoreductase [Chlorobiaceae bacterium]|nr:SDR family oxidoreductase [Chlorobiaceae bacterium]
MAGYWEGKTAVVTGAASGIGLALSEELIRRGASVWLTDIDTAALERSAAGFGPNARGHELDVRDSAAVRDLVEFVAKESGRLDFMFNNAGIIMPGEVHDLDIDHFDRIIDVNIRGVVNGTLAAYPVMVRQRCGHIVNTASLAGLAPAPLLSSYAMTKHAVVGLTSSLRFEAARYGVRVSAICPSAVNTPMLDAGTPQDLQKVPWRPNVRRYLRRLNGPPADPRSVAASALAGVEKNQALIIVPARAGLIAMVYRLAPGLVHSLGRLVVAAELNGRPPVGTR